MNRSTQPEIMDSPQAAGRSETERMYRELVRVNRWLGGAGSAVRVLRPLLTALLKRKDRRVPLVVVDLGGGSADIVRRLDRTMKPGPDDLRLLSLDFNRVACEMAARTAGGRADGFVIQGDLRSLPLAASSCDVVFCSSVLHHFTDSEIVAILRRLSGISRHLVVVIDLHRHRFAYWSFRVLSRICFRSRLVRHDGPLSVLKGFRRHELHELFTRAGLRRVDIHWQWAFRWVAIARVFD